MIGSSTERTSVELRVRLSREVGKGELVQIDEELRRVLAKRGKKDGRTCFL